MRSLRRDRDGFGFLVPVLILFVLVVVMFAILFAVFGGGVPAPGAPTCVLSGRVFAPQAPSASVTITQSSTGSIPVAWTSVDPKGSSEFTLNLGCVGGLIATASATGYRGTVVKALPFGIQGITSDKFYASLAL
jgi:hypothetical protein